MNEQWQELKETIIELRDNDGTGTQQEVCKFLANLMDVLEKGESLINDDAISRQAVLDHIYGINGLEGFELSNVFEKHYADFIKSLPSVTPQPEMGRWIPVSERLPEIHQDVLLSLRSLDVEVGFRGNTEPYYYCHGDYIEPQNVLAWQPLPEPYKAESEVSDANSN